MYELEGYESPEFPRYAPNGQYTQSTEVGIQNQSYHQRPRATIFPSSPTLFRQTRESSSPSTCRAMVHSSFASLPEVVLQRLRTVNSVEMPDRIAFDASLCEFLAALTPELRETAAFGPEMYANVSNCVANGDTSIFSPRLRMWLVHHHIRLGSNRFHLLLVPRDSYFQIDRTEEERLRLEYVTRVDGKGKGLLVPSSTKDTVEHDLNALEWTRAFERIPVQTQIYDVLVYAHRAHATQILCSLKLEESEWFVFFL